MKKQVFKIAIFIGLIIVAGVLQNSNLFNIFGVKPNLSLVVLAALGFFAGRFLDYLILVLISGLLLKTEPGFEFAAAAFIGVVILLYFSERFLPWRSIINNLVLVAFGTAIMYFVINPGFVIANLGVFLGEMMFNLSLGSAIFLALSRFYEKEISKVRS